MNVATEAPSGLRTLLPALAEESALAGLLGRRDARIAVPEAAQAMMIAAICEAGDRRPVVVVAPTSSLADRLADDLATWLGDGEAEAFPAWETLPFERVSPGVETMGRRLRLIHRLQSGTAPRCIVVPIRALLQRLAPSSLTASPITVAVGQQIDQDEFMRHLVDLGYRRDAQVEHRGDVAVRGSIIDVFPSTAAVPVRIDLWGDEVDRLTEFAVADQRSTGDIGEVEIHGCREFSPVATDRARAEALMASAPWGREHWQRLADGELFDGMESWLPWFVAEDQVIGDLFGGDAHVVLLEPTRLAQRATDLLAEEADLASTLAVTWGASQSADEADLPRLHVDWERALAQSDAPLWAMTPSSTGPDTPAVDASGWDRPIGEGRGPIAQTVRLLADGYRVVVCADQETTARRMHTLLGEHGIDMVLDLEGVEVAGRRSCVTVAPLSRGAIVSDVALAVLSEPELTGRRRAHRRSRKRAQRSADLEDLAPGSYVVHRQHGIARYQGMEKRAISGIERDYLVLEYRGTDRLFLPSDQIDAIRQYTGGDSPTLSRMGGAEWQKAKSKVKSAVAEVAQELVVLYQQRVTSPGHAFAADTPWQRELEDSFPFQETPDQLKAIDEVKADMEQSIPMDRLVCGDVGFGKTEIALRAAFKAIQDGRQVAVLVPTTLLAQQHHQTFTERFAGYPIRVEVLSRFLTAKQARTVTADLAEGKVDLIIGTHRLLSGDVEIPRLGLLVIDEEQRFGVKHKEAIKQMKAAVDVLTLTATPIPRTLEMSLTGIRDLTLLHTPPAERQPILTYVGEYDERAVAEALRRELLREGQVFFVHNRVQDIEEVADELRSLVPEARVAVAHGQMDEGSLEQVVYDFWEREYDVLVCTTIIESGIDMPSVNTLVVDRADLLGLGQMHQLRGRVGRSGQRAYAYLFHPRDKVLSEDAYERLKTVGEATELGSGFRIAMRDLEIRGAGNLVGTGQSGHIAAVGYDLYCQLVTEAVSGLKGETVEAEPEVRIELPVAANLPEDYVPDETMRLMAYRRLTSVRTLAEIDDVREEWLDRFGEIPEPAQSLLDVATLRVRALNAGIDEVIGAKGPGFGGPKATVKLRPVKLAASREVRLGRLYPKSDYKPEAGVLQLSMPSVEGLARDTLEAMEALGLIPEDDAATAAEAAPSAVT